ncbi:unnamed protein product [Urochloa decumbens]|uniref:Uncharacterized protein n=1 Tax=Urochloa decumbens TaxID=240449 RepID=A0ABC8Z7V0_9POAL
MSRFFRRAALAAAAAGGLTTAVVSWSLSSPLPLAASPACSPTTPAAAAATGHLALVRAHPGLGELGAMLTPASFLVDATQALLAGALRCTPFYPETLRQGRAYLAAQIGLSAELEGDAVSEEEAASHRIHMALLDARDGDLAGALDAVAHLAAERPSDTTARLYAAALSHVLGRHREGRRYLRDAAVTDLSRLEHKMPFVEGVLVSTVGSAPRAVAGSEELVLRTTLGLVELTMWSAFQHGDLRERLEALAWMAFLRGVVARKLDRDAPLEG